MKVSHQGDCITRFINLQTVAQKWTNLLLDKGTCVLLSISLEDDDYF